MNYLGIPSLVRCDNRRICGGNLLRTRKVV